MTQPIAIIAAATAVSVAAALGFGLLHTVPADPKHELVGVWSEIGSIDPSTEALTAAESDIKLAALKPRVEKCKFVAGCVSLVADRTVVRRELQIKQGLAPEFAASPPARGMAPLFVQEALDIPSRSQVAELNNAPLIAADRAQDQWRIGVYR